ncbi:MAG: 50S ribosomal protein L5 [Acidobacteria bacterium]|nr:50S ribosomal protein L5 [Acidobacteriota bacterium]
MATTPRLQERYRKEILPEITKQFAYPSPMAAPRITKIVVNMGVGEAKENIKILDAAVEELGLITGQRPALRRAKKSIANFKLREGVPVGCCVTLRGNRMYEFLDRLVSIALPRVRDFKGVSEKAFDGRGNYTLGVTDQSIFPEVTTGKVEKIKGMNITIVTTARTDNESRALLQAFGVPFRKP